MKNTEKLLSFINPVKIFKGANALWMAITYPILAKWDKAKPLFFVSGSIIFADVIMLILWAGSLLLGSEKFTVIFGLIAGFLGVMISLVGKRAGSAIIGLGRIAEEDLPPIIIQKANKLSRDAFELIGKEIASIFQPFGIMAIIVSFLSMMVAINGFDSFWASKMTIFAAVLGFFLFMAIIRGGNINVLYNFMVAIAVITIGCYLVEDNWEDIKASDNVIAKKTVSVVNLKSTEIEKSASDDDRKSIKTKTAAKTSYGRITEDRIEYLYKKDGNDYKVVPIQNYCSKEGYGIDTIINYLLRGEVVWLPKLKESVNVDGIELCEIALRHKKYKKHLPGERYFIEVEQVSKIVDGLKGKNAQSFSAVTGDYANPIILDIERTALGVLSKTLSPANSYYLAKSRSFRILSSDKGVQFMMKDGRTFTVFETMTGSPKFDCPFKVTGRVKIKVV